MPVLEAEKIYPERKKQEEYRRVYFMVRKQIWALIIEEAEIMSEELSIPKLRKTLVPDWILELAKGFEGDEVILEQALEESRRISKKFKTPLSGEIIAEREMYLSTRERSGKIADHTPSFHLRTQGET